MRVFVGMETSGRSRRAFQSLGHWVVSCDLLPSQDNVSYSDATGGHVVGDVFETIMTFMDRGIVFDLAIFHPDCTYLTGSAEWAYGDGPYHQKIKPGTLVGVQRRVAREQALDTVRRIMALPIECIAIENPVGCISTRIRKPDQIVQPFDFGDDASKKTCLWLQGLPPLSQSRRVPGRLVEWPRGSGKIVERWSNQTDSGQNNLTPSGNRWADRSDTYPGIASAMARSWADLRSPWAHFVRTIIQQKVEHA